MNLKINDDLRAFLDDPENQELLNKNAFEKLYNRLKLKGDNVPLFTRLIWAADLDPLEYMRAIPDFYLSNDEDIVALVVPEHIERIADRAFAGCTNLRDISFRNCDKLTRIGCQSFIRCEAPYSIEFPDNLRDIDDFAFKHCNSLQNIYLPNSIKNIGLGSFSDCVNLRSIQYEGSMDEWDHVYKGSNCFLNIRAYAKIFCKDGILEINK